MTLRLKLLISYGAMLAIVLVIVTGVHYASKRSRLAASNLARAYEQGVTAERLRWDIRQLVAMGLQFAAADTSAADSFTGLEQKVQDFIGGMRIKAEEAYESELELDHISGFDESFQELLWIVSQIRHMASDSVAQGRVDRWVRRMHEIQSDVDDAAIALEQYLRGKNREYLARAEWAGRMSIRITVLAAALGLSLLLSMVFLVHRWVIRPIADLEKAADAVGEGELELHIPPRPEAEWRTVADALQQMTRSLSMMRQQLRTAERLGAIGEVAAYTAHNIRNPLASIRAMTQSALSEPGNAPLLKETHEDIIRCVDKMENWVARLLGYARPLSLQPETCALADVIADARLMVERMATLANVTVETRVEPESLHIVCDPSLMEQVAYLLLSNAIEATPAGGRVSFTAELDKEHPEENAVLTVEDTGHGIPSDLLGRVFDPFVTSKKGGSGLGLAQVRNMIDLHLGTIDIASEVGHGTRVTIRLPLKTTWGVHGTDSNH